MSAEIELSEGKRGTVTAARAWASVAILAVTYAVSFLDRQILVLLVDPIRADLGLSDTGVSLLTGFAFALFYASMGLPMGRLADHWSRKRLIMLGVATWGAMTILCGMANSFLQLFIGRMGVGIGEATLTPTAYAMIPDLFPKGRQARAMSLFVLGGSAGAGLSLILAAGMLGTFNRLDQITMPLIGPMRPWQATIIGVGLVTLLVLIPLAWISDPRSVKPARRGALLSLSDMTEVLHQLWRRRRQFGPIFLGLPLANAFTFGLQAWTPSFFIRVHGWSATQAGTALGLVALGAGVAGVIVGGWGADSLLRRGMRDPMVPVSAIAYGLMVPLPLAMALAGSDLIALRLFGLIIFVVSVPNTLIPVALQTMTPPHMRAQTSALFLLAVNLVGIGFGPTMVAMMTDYVFRDDRAVGWSIAALGTIANGLAALILFAASHPAVRPDQDADIVPSA